MERHWQMAKLFTLAQDILDKIDAAGAGANFVKKDWRYYDWFSSNEGWFWTGFSSTI